MSERIKKKFVYSVSLNYVYAILVPVSIVIAALVSLSIVPFGDKTLLISDADAYYKNYIAYLRGVVTGEHGLLYSFSKSLGGTLVNIFPGTVFFNICFWVFPLLPLEYLPLAYTLSYLVYVGVCGLGAYLLLRDIYDGDHKYLLIFSTSYAVMGYSVVNNFQFVYYPGPMTLPFLMLGVRHLVHKNKVLLYVFSLAYILATSFQLGFSMCIFSVLYFFMMIKTDESEDRETYINFIVSSISGGFISAFSWLPSFLSFFGGRGSQTSLDDFVFSANMPFVEMGALLFTGGNSTMQLSDGLPVLFVGILVLFLTVLYFLDSSVYKKEKIGYALLLLIYAMSFFIKMFTTIFHGFTHTNWFNYRYSFIPSMLMIIVAAFEFERLKQIEVGLLKKTLIVIVISAIVIFSREDDFADVTNVIIDFLILTIMAILLYMYRKGLQGIYRRSFTVLIMGCVFVNLYMNFCISTQNVMDWAADSKEYREKYEENKEAVDIVKGMDDTFYRMEIDGEDMNLSFLYGYNGVSSVSNAQKKDVINGIGRLGVRYYAEMQNIYDRDMSLSMEALLGIKYLISPNDFSEQKGYKRISGGDELSIYENTAALPLAILADRGIDEITIKDNLNVFSVQNDMWRGISGGTENVFEEEADVYYHCHNATDDKEIYGSGLDDARKYYHDSRERSLSDSEENTATDEDDRSHLPYIEYSFNADRNGRIYLYSEAQNDPERGEGVDVLTYLGEYKSGENVSGRFFVEKDIDIIDQKTADYLLTQDEFKNIVGGIHICYENEDLLNDYVKKIKEKDVYVNKETDNRLIGEYNIEGNDKMLFTIPYDEGWSMYVDGKPVEIKKAADLFISADVPGGNHEYELIYFPVGLGLSIWMTLIGGLLITGMELWYNLKDSVKKKKVENDNGK